MLTPFDRKRVHRIKALTPGLCYKYRNTPFKNEYESLEEELSTRRFIKANRMFKKTAIVLEQLRKQMEARDNNAVNVIRRFWFSKKHSSTKRLIKKFLDVGLLGSKVREMGFEALVPFLRHQQTIKATKDILQRFHEQAIHVHGMPDVAPEDLNTVKNVNVRVFVASYMIAFFPGHVFESTGLLESELRKSSTELITCFEEMVAQFNANNMGFTGISNSVRGKFINLLFGYLIIFKKWKVPDEAKLTIRIRKAIRALHIATLQLPADENPNSRLSFELRTQTTRLYEKLRQIAGRDAVTQLRAEIAAIDINTVQIGSIDDIVAEERLSNEDLAHQLLLDPHYQLEYVDTKAISNTRFFCHERFWDAMKADLLASPPYYDRVKRTFDEIYGNISDVTSYSEEQCNSVFDPVILRQCLDNNAFDWSDVISIGNHIYKVIRFFQNPKHDAESRAKWNVVKAALDSATSKEEQANAFVGMFRFFLDHFGKMRIDMGNTRLRLISGVIIVHGVDYEKGKFKTGIENGNLTIAKTQKYIQDAVLFFIQHEPKIAIDRLRAGNGDAYLWLLSKAILNLVFTPAIDVNAMANDIPETHRFDKTFLKNMPEKLCLMASTQSAVSMVKKALGIRCGFTVVEIKGITDAFSKPLKKCVRDDFEQVLIENLTAELAKTSLTDDAQREILSNTLRCCMPGNPAYNVLHPMIKSTFTDIFQKRELTHADIAAIKYCPVVVENLVQAHKTLRRIFEVSLLVHGERYNSIIRAVVGSI